MPATDIMVDLTIPVSFSPNENFDLSAFSENDFVTAHKLDIFSVGETGDRRLFTKSFSDKLLESLPYTPVVAYYNDGSEDFNGHNMTQYIYGIVPPNAKVEYINRTVTNHKGEEEEKTFARTDVILYTGRNDNIGEVAKKIPGMQHSLELDPATVDYEIHRDQDGKIMTIEFKDGKLIGLSVVGDAETPAFAGSGFFTEANDQQKEEFQSFLDSFKVLTDKMEKFLEENKKRGEQGMEREKELFEISSQRFGSFIKETYNEKAEKLTKVLNAKYEYTFIIQMDDDQVVFSTFDEEFEVVTLRASYSQENEVYSIGDATEVKRRYLTDEEINKTFTVEPTENETAEGSEEVKSETEEAEQETFTANSQTEGVDENDNATLNQSERAELESFRTQAKESKIEEFEKFLSESKIEEFKEKVNEFSMKELETALSLAAFEVMKEREVEAQAAAEAEASQVVQVEFNTTAAPQEEKEEEESTQEENELTGMDAYIARYLNK